MYFLLQFCKNPDHSFSKGVEGIITGAKVKMEESKDAICSLTRNPNKKRTELTIKSGESLRKGKTSWLDKSFCINHRCPKLTSIHARRWELILCFHVFFSYLQRNKKSPNSIYHDFTSVLTNIRMFLSKNSGKRERLIPNRVFGEMKMFFFH